MSSSVNFVKFLRAPIFKEDLWQLAASENLKLIVILCKHMLLYFCLSPSQLLGRYVDQLVQLDIRQIGRRNQNRLNTKSRCYTEWNATVQTTRNSTPVPSSTRSRNSTRVGALGLSLLCSQIHHSFVALCMLWQC